MLDQVIDHCVDRIGGRANYVDGVRVVHRVVSSREIGLAEWQFHIDTIVMADDESAVLRTYSSTCTTLGADNVNLGSGAATVHQDASAPFKFVIDPAMNGTARN